MQEAELLEYFEQLFTSALVRTYQRDALIDLHRALRQSWRNLMRPSDQRATRIKLEGTLQQINHACLRSQQNASLADVDREIISQIESQFIQLEEQMKS
jgi:hypothetical protein